MTKGILATFLLAAVACTSSAQPEPVARGTTADRRACSKALAARVSTSGAGYAREGDAHDPRINQLIRTLATTIDDERREAIDALSELCRAMFPDYFRVPPRAGES